MNQTRLTGLEGTNPLGFLAALGVQVAFASESEQPRLWWSDDVIPHAVVDEEFDLERIANQCIKVFALWRDSPAIAPKRPDGSDMPKSDELKLKPDDIRRYLQLIDQCDLGEGLITALVAEGSLDNQDVAKPSDLYFTAGKQKFLATVRQILDGVSQCDVLSSLEGPWYYESVLPSLGWDVVDDRVYALRAHDPAPKSGPDPKRTNPGPEALAILGLSLHPVFGSRDRTLTQGCSGSWKSGFYSWPLWSKPASPRVAKSLLAHAYVATVSDRDRWFRAWGIFRILRSPIRRSRQGGYGTFGPPEVAWQSL